MRVFVPDQSKSDQATKVCASFVRRIEVTLADAEHETYASLLLNPGQSDARNLLGVIYAQEGEAVRASVVWRELVRDLPGYEPARANLEILGSRSPVATGKTAAVALPPAAAVRAIGDDREPHLPTSEYS